MSFKADIVTFEGKVLVKDAYVTQMLGPAGSLIGFGANVKDTDHDSVDEMDYIFGPGAPVYFKLKAPEVDNPTQLGAPHVGISFGVHSVS